MTRFNMKFIISFKNISKITVKLKGNGLRKLQRRYFSQKLSRFEKLFGVVVFKINLNKQKLFQMATKSPILTQ